MSFKNPKILQPEVLPVTGPPTDMATPLTSTKSPIEAVKESRPNMSTRTMEAKEMTAAKDIPKKAEATITFWSQDKKIIIASQGFLK